MGVLIERQNILDHYSQNGVDHITDDVSSEEIDEKIEWAESEVLGRLAGEYTNNVLKQSGLIVKITVLITCYFLSGRRANPKLFGPKTYEEVIEDLESIKYGELDLVDSTGQLLSRKNDHLGVSMSNMVVDESYGVGRIRVIDRNSVQTNNNADTYWREGNLSGFFGF